MNFQEFIEFADTLAGSEISNKYDNLASLKDLVRLTLL